MHEAEIPARRGLQQLLFSGSHRQNFSHEATKNL
jgi:hypothetical protein